MARVQDIKTTDVIVKDLGGRDRKLVYDLNAFGVLEERFGSINDAFEALSTGSIKALRVLLWAGLLWDETVLDSITGEPVSYNITPYAVGSWIKPNRIQEISDKIGQAMTGDMPQEVLDEIKKEETKSNLGADGTLMAVVIPDEGEQEVKN